MDYLLITLGRVPLRAFLHSWNNETIFLGSFKMMLRVSGSIRKNVLKPYLIKIVHVMEKRSFFAHSISLIPY